MEKGSLKELNDGGYNNLLYVVLGLAALYFLVTGASKTNKQLYLENAGIDKPTQQAQALRDAMNRSGITLMMSVDGTDVELIMQTALAIESYPAVSDAYRVLYSSELTLDLQSELSRTDLQRFYDIVYKRNGQVATTTASTLIGKAVVAKQTVNLRYDTAPYAPIPNLFFTSPKQASKGEKIGTYLSERIIDVGFKDTFVLVKTTGLLGLSENVYVHKGSVKIG